MECQKVACIGIIFYNIALRIGQFSANKVVGINSFPVIGYTAVNAYIVACGVVVKIDKRLSCDPKLLRWGDMLLFDFILITTIRIL